MKQLWTQYEEYFEARSRRERLLITLTVLAAIVIIGYTTAIEPLLIRQKSAQGQITQQKTELANLQQQIAATQAGIRNEGNAVSASLDRMQQQISDINSRLKAITKTLVPPASMPGFLEGILKRNRGIQLVSLRNIPADDVLQKSVAPAANAKRTDPTAKAASVLKREESSAGKTRLPSFDEFGGSLFKHGVEITVAGNYHDLLAYLSQLETMEQQVLWSSIKLTVEEHPRARMTLTVYTLSFDRTWLTV